MELKTIFLCIYLAMHFTCSGYGQIMYRSKETVVDFQQLSKNVVLAENMESCEKNTRRLQGTSTITLDVLQSALSYLHSVNTSLLENLVKDVCERNPFLIFAHPVECQLYYNCAVNISDRRFPFHMAECKYPDMFSTRTLQCEKYTEVECGDRIEIKSECNYRVNARGICRFGSCGAPCERWNPTCEGKKDGMQTWTYLEGSPYYVICHQERVIEKGRCPNDLIWETISLPYNGKCTSQFEIPERSTRCSELGDGKYHFSKFYNTYQCRIYFACVNGIRTGMKCPNDTVFDAENGECKKGQVGLGIECERYCDSLSYNVKNNNTLVFGMRECPYPNFFSRETQQCINKYISCVKRNGGSDECSYFRTHHMPHYFNYNNIYLSCINKSDGLHEHSERILSPYYMICEKQQNFCEGYCPYDNFWKTVTFPFKGKCTPPFEIPKLEYPHGELPSCEGQSDGTYQFPNRKCDAYYKCENGTATGIKCPENTVFDKNSGMCKNGNCAN